MLDIKAIIKSKGLYQTVLPTGETFVWRLLSLQEYDVFARLRQAEAILDIFLYEEVFNYCYVGNSDVINGNLPAGYFSSIGQVIMHLSGDGGIGQEKTEILQARERYQASSVLETMKRTILVAFPSYLPEQVEAFNRVELLDRFTQAEYVLMQRAALVVPTVAVEEGGYKPIDVRKITKANSTNNLDFKKDNEEINRVMQKESLLDEHPLMLSKAQNKTNHLEKRQARQLDRLVSKAKRK